LSLSSRRKYGSASALVFERGEPICRIQICKCFARHRDVIGAVVGEQDFHRPALCFGVAHENEKVSSQSKNRSRKLAESWRSFTFFPNAIAVQKMIQFNADQTDIIRKAMSG